jgi:hypothetical protein
VTSFIADIPQKPALTRLKHIRPVHDLTSVLLHRESFTKFESDVLATYSRHLEARLPSWDSKDYPDAKAVSYVNRIFKSHLPRYEDTPSKLPGNDLAIVINSPKLSGAGLGIEIDSHKTVLRLNHRREGEHTHKDVGFRTTLQMMDENSCYEFTRNLLPANLGHTGIFNIFSGVQSELAACLEYARYLDCGGDSSSFFVLKPSFRGAITALSESGSPSLGFIATAFALRLFDNITVYGHAASPSFEHSELLACASQFTNFSIR